MGGGRVVLRAPHRGAGAPVWEAEVKVRLDATDA